MLFFVCLHVIWRNSLKKNDLIVFEKTRRNKRFRRHQWQLLLRTLP